MPDPDTGPASSPATAIVIDIRAELSALIPELRAFARFLVRNRSAADDLVQDTVVRALGAISQFIPGSNLRGWLFTIQRNLHYEQARRRRTEQRVLAETFPAEHAQGPAQHGQAALSELQRHMWTLPTALREALVLVGAQGLSYDEAAVICGVAEGTMKARVSRARQRLAAQLGHAANAAGTPEPP